MVVIKEYSDGLVVRHAEPDDKDAVAQIDVYGDEDYLRGMYDHYMEHPNYLCFLAELKERVVAFCKMCIVDDGEAVIAGAKRVHEDFRGQGHFARFIGPVEEHVVRQYPKLKVWKYGALWDDYQKKHVPYLQQAGALRKLVMQNCWWANISLATLQSGAIRRKICQLCREYNVDTVESVSNEQVPPDLLDKTTQEELFPNDRAIVFWEPYAPLLSNFQYIMRTSKCNITHSDSKVKAVSFTSDVEARDRSMVRVEMNMYISSVLPPDEQINQFQRHMIKALQMLSENDKYSSYLNMFFCMYTSQNFDIANVRAWARGTFHADLGLGPDTVTENFHQFIFCEYDRNKLMTSDGQ